MRTVWVALVCLLAACAGVEAPGESGDAPTQSRSSSPSGQQPTRSKPTTEPSSTGPSSTGSSPPPAPGTEPPGWLGTRVLPEGATGLTTPKPLRHRRFTLPDRLPMLPGTGFKARVRDPAPARVIRRSTWNDDCPVAASELAWIRLTFHGFDGERHTGELLAHSATADDLVQVFGDLWRAEFPIEQMTITTEAERDAPPTGDGNNTGAFNCRPVTGGSSYSEHAKGLAIDINPFQNPYQKGEVVLPELARSYLDRADVRPGMTTADGPVVRAFARIGWGWGGAWRTLDDYQHFSANDR